MGCILAFSAQQRAKIVIWYYQSRPNTQTQRNVLTAYAISLPTQNSILRCARKFKKLGRVKNAHASRRFEVSSA